MVQMEWTNEGGELINWEDARRRNKEAAEEEGVSSGREKVDWRDYGAGLPHLPYLLFSHFDNWLRKVLFSIRMQYTVFSTVYIVCAWKTVLSEVKIAKREMRK